MEYTKGELATIQKLANDDELLEVGRKAVEDVLVEWRNSRISMCLRGNGLVIRERNGGASSIIRMGPEQAMKIGLKAIAEHIKKGG